MQPRVWPMTTICLENVSEGTFFDTIVLSRSDTREISRNKWDQCRCPVDMLSLGCEIFGNYVTSVPDCQSWEPCLKTPSSGPQAPGKLVCIYFLRQPIKLNCKLNKDKEHCIAFRSCGCNWSVEKSASGIRAAGQYRTSWHGLTPTHSPAANAARSRRDKEKCNIYLNTGEMKMRNKEKMSSF